MSKGTHFVKNLAYNIAAMATILIALFLFLSRSVISSHPKNRLATTYVTYDFLTEKFPQSFIALFLVLLPLVLLLSFVQIRRGQKRGHGR